MQPLRYEWIGNVTPIGFGLWQPKHNQLKQKKITWVTGKDLISISGRVDTANRLLVTRCCKGASVANYP
jgi:hypothetical protein